MGRALRRIGVAMSLTVTVLGGVGCAQLPQWLTSLGSDSVHLPARGSGAVFGSVDAAAVDALAYAYLQGQAAHDTERVRGGTIQRVEDGYTYGDIRVAGPLTPHRLRTPLRERDVARFLIYTRTGRRDVDRANEEPSKADRRSVTVTDPLHRPLYILHPSLVIREYRGEGHELVEVADLRRPPKEMLLAGQ